MRSVSIDELYLLQRVLGASGQSSLVTADLSTLRLRTSVRADALNFAVDPASSDSRYAGTAHRTTVGGPAGQPLAVAVTVDQYGKLYGIDVTDPAGGRLAVLAAPQYGAAVPAVVGAPSPGPGAGAGAWAGATPSAGHGTMAIVGFILTLLPVMNVVGLVLSIIAFVRAKRSGSPRGFALAGILIGAGGVLLVVVIAATIGPFVVDAVETCNRLGIGEHQVGDLTYSCGYGAVRVTRSF
ncbi:hypothetical protein [Plantibacter sp. YIM 135347]|uniref:hypothetical protein n=1 Tax=Plantibacter sp. YIM 135347 TaxID=3423919 RepID=UPI003D32C3D0